MKTAYVPGFDGFAIKISPGFFDNPKLGLPSVNGLMVYLSARTGLVEALLLDNGYLTNVRTAAAGAVAAKHLSRADASVAAILGAGAQARLQLEALTLVRPIREARMWTRPAEAAQAAAAAAEMTEKLGIPVKAVADAAEAVRGADIVVTTTPASEPILQADWLVARPARHRHGLRRRAQERDRSGRLRPRDLCRRQPGADPAPRRTAPCAGGEDGRRRCGLRRARPGDRRHGARPPRADEITLCDLTGTGAQDTAIATLAVARAKAARAGTLFHT